MAENNTLNFDFRSWIKDHQSDDYQIISNSDSLIQLQTDFGEASIGFTEIEESTIVEFTIISKKDDSVKFYLHFELSDEDHAKQLYDEMVETLIGLKDEKTLKVLLSCSAGLTTAMFADSLNKTAKTLGLDYQFDAVPYLSIYEEVENYDVVLIAPQIGYMYNRLNESLINKLVLQIPTAAFASYDALTTIELIRDELENFNISQNNLTHKDKTHCFEYDNRILSIVIMINRAQVRIYYRLYDKKEIIDSNLIIKPSMNIYDLYDIIDTLLLKHSYIDIIGLATPGIVGKDQVIKYLSYKEEPIDIKADFENKYNINVFTSNNTNAAVVGFALEHPEYQNIVFHSQPFGFHIGGQGVMQHGKIVTGKNGIAGEIKFYLDRMQFSDKLQQLAWTEQGVLEVVTKSLLPVICILGPEAIAVRSPMTPNMDEIRNKLASFIPEEFLPDFFYVKEASSYMLDGITKLCVDHFEHK